MRSAQPLQFPRQNRRLGSRRYGPTVDRRAGAAGTVQQRGDEHTTGSAGRLRAQRSNELLCVTARIGAHSLAPRSRAAPVVLTGLNKDKPSLVVSSAMTTFALGRRTPACATPSTSSVSPLHAPPEQRRSSPATNVAARANDSGLTSAAFLSINRAAVTQVPRAASLRHCAKSAAGSLLASMVMKMSNTSRRRFFDVAA